MNKWAVSTSQTYTGGPCSRHGPLPPGPRRASLAALSSSLPTKALDMATGVTAPSPGLCRLLWVQDRARVFPTPGAQEGSSHSRAGLPGKTSRKKAPNVSPPASWPLSDSILSLHSRGLGPAHLMAPATPLFPADLGITRRQGLAPILNTRGSKSLAGMGVQGSAKVERRG